MPTQHEPIDKLNRLLTSHGHLEPGKGMMTGVIALALSLLCALGVLAFHFPAYLTTPQLRQMYDVDIIRYIMLAAMLVAGGLALTGQFEDAARLHGFAVAHWQRLSGPFYRDLERDVSFTRRVLRQQLGAVRLEALRLQGLSLSLPHAVALALGHSI